MLFTVTANVCATDEPHVLLTVTVISPPVVLAVVAMVSVVEMPVQPVGNVQV